MVPPDYPGLLHRKFACAINNFKKISSCIERLFLAFILSLLVFFVNSLSAHQGTDHVAIDENLAQLAQGYAPFEVSPAAINVPAQADFDVFGSWGPVQSWPHIPVSAANLADGRILTWASNRINDFVTNGPEYTYASVWDPATNTFIDVPHTSHDMFCAHQVMLEDGRVFVNGGRSHGPFTSIFDSATNTWTTLEPMNAGRWYPTSVALPDGGVFTAIGASGGKFPEVWHPGLGWKLLTGIDLQIPILNYTSFYEQDFWPFISISPDGDLVHYGPTPDMHRFDPSGTGTISPAGVMSPGWFIKDSASVIIDEGKILLAGGATSGSVKASTNGAMIIDINGPTPIITPVAPMTYARKFHNAVVLPNGEVLMIGGNTSGIQFNDVGTQLTGEIWNPATQTWRVTADMSVPRNYHSIAMLLVDGRVLSGGGGLCGGCSTNHQNAQIYSPPYLFNDDGTLATRPVISSIPDVINVGDVFSVSATPAVQSFSMIKLSSTTHAMNTDQRFLNAPFVETSSGQYQLTSHININVLTPGYYFLFALDAQGVPSIAKILQVSAGIAPSNYPPTVLQLQQLTNEVGDNVSLFIPAIDINGDTLSFTAAGLPTGLALDSSTGELTGITTTVELKSVSVTVTDTNGDSSNMSFDWDVVLTGNGLGSILREWWSGIPGYTIPDLTGYANFPDTPTGSEVLTTFETPTNWSNNYGTKMSGYVHAPVTGDYEFWIASNDRGELWMSTDSDPANKSLIALVPGWTNPREWNKYSQQQSFPITLQKGQTYYIEALHKQENGFDNLAVAWQIPGGSGQTVIPGIYLTPFGSSPNNNSPVMTNPGLQSSVVGSTIDLDVIANDPDGDPLTYSAVGLPGGLSIDSGTGKISGVTNAVGITIVIINVIDTNGRTDSVFFNWYVNLSTNNLPNLTAPGNQTHTEGNSINLAIVASDPDGDILVYTALGLPAGLSIDSVTGIVTGTVSTAGVYNVTVTVDDGNGNSDNGNFTWTVNVPSLAVTPIIATPTATGSEINFTASAQGGQNLQYKWDFGDGTLETAFSSSPAINHIYTSPGRFTVTLTVTESGGDTVLSTFIQAIHQPLTANRPGISMSIIYEALAGNDRIWNVNPDNNTVSVFDVITHTKQAEIKVGAGPRSLAFAPDGRIWVVNKDAASISIINPVTFSVEATVSLPVNTQPFGLVFSPSGSHAYISLEAGGVILQLSTVNGSQTGSVDVGFNVRHLSITADGAKLLASRFITPSIPNEHTALPQITSATASGGEVLVIDVASLTISNTVILHHNDAPDASNAGRGIPNYLGPAVISPDGSTAWVPSKQDNIKRGTLRDGLPLTHDSAVRSITSRIDLSNEQEALAARMDHDDAGIASTALFDQNGNYLYVALEGSRETLVIDVFSGNEITRIDVGRAPQGLALSPDGYVLYTHNFMDRSITVHDLNSVLTSTVTIAPLLATYNLVANEMLSSTVLLGKQHFYDAADSRLALQNYLSCASCHNDGGHDGRIWDFTGFGEGLRNTIDLRGHSGMAQGPLHWSANFDEVQDFEGQIRNFAFGLGLMSDTDFHAGTRSQPLGDIKAGISGDLDALAAYVTSLSSSPGSPYRNTDGSTTTIAVSGQAVFLAANCISCHSGSHFTDSAQGNLHDIGTLKASSGNRLGVTLTGIDTPTLRGVWATAPYLHDGSAATLSDAISAHTNITLTSIEKSLLVGYLQELDDSESTPIDSDNDNLPDDLEAILGTNPFSMDTDGDTLSDYDELSLDGDPGNYTAGIDLNPLLQDTDNDGYRDDTDPYPLVFNSADGDLAPLGSPDGVVNVADLLICQRIILGDVTATTLELSHGDLYPVGVPDGIINMSDYIILQKMVLGIP